MRESELSARSRVRWTIVLIALLGLLSGYFLKNSDLLQGIAISRSLPRSLTPFADLLLQPNPAFLPGF